MNRRKNIALGIIALSLAILAGIAIYDKWSSYRRAKEAEAALAQMETNKPSRFQADLPASRSNPTESSSKLFVSINSDGVLNINGEPAGTLDDTSQMRVKLSQIIQARNDKAVMVKASSKLKYSVVNKLIDEIRGVGAEPVGLQVDALAAN